MQLVADTLLQGRYRVQALIAQGGMGAVYRAVDERLGNTVALKQTLMRDPQLRAAFEREARLLAGLQHPALPVVSDHFAEGEDQFLVMQFIPGDDLATMLRQRGAFAPAEAMPWADRLLDALDYLHSRHPPVIHRDIKPLNLKLTPRGELILLDFGLAKGEPGAGTASGGRSIFGYTPQYAPLEQIQGSGTDARGDLYSFGATFYQLLSGQEPPDALSRAAASVSGQADPLRPAHAINPQLPPALSDLLQGCMALNPAQRPASAAAARAQLRAAMERPATTQFVAPAASSAGEPTRLIAREAATGPTIRARPGEVTAPGLPVGLRLLAMVAALCALLILGGLGLLLLAPRGPGVALSATAGPPPAGPGSSRAEPLPIASPARIDGWEVQVREVVRGDAAWDLLHAENPNNDPAPEGMRYVLVRLLARPGVSSADNRDLYPKLTGDRLVSYLPVAAVTPARLPEEYQPGQEIELDIPYLIPASEGSLMLQVEDLGSATGSAPVFVALDAGAALSVDPELRQIRPTKLGADPREPAAVGETATGEDYQVTVREVLRGDAAYARLKAANSFNDPPAEGREYLLAYVEVRSLGTKDETVLVSDSDFFSLRGRAADPDATVLRSISSVEPEPALSAYLYPGGSAAGWVAVEAPAGAEDVLLGFSPGYGSNDLNTRYFAIE